MTNFTKNLILAMAACTIAAGTAAAQTYEAQIPFTFRAGNTVMAPGAYQIHLSNATMKGMLHITNTDSHNSILLLSSGMTGATKGPDKPALRFECVDHRCSLGSVWVGGYEGAYLIPTPKLGRDEKARLEVVTVTAVKAD